MARPLRIQRTGCWYHVTARGNERRQIFVDDKDRRHFLGLLEATVWMFSLRLHAFVLMSNHYHLLLEITKVNLSRSVQWLNTSYSVWFNRRHRRSGHLLQGRFKSVVVEPESWGLEVSRYLHLNPVRLRQLGLGKAEVQRSRSIGVEELSPEQVRERVQVLRRYPWSSYRGYIGSAKVPAWLTTVEVLGLGGKSRQPAEQYREYCEEAIRQGGKQSPWQNVIEQSVLGTERFVARLAKALEKSEAGERLKKRPTLDRIIRVVERVRDEKWEAFRDRYGDPSRDLVLYLGRTVCGMSFRELSERVAIEYSSAAGAVQRFSRRGAKDSEIATLIKHALQQIDNE